MDSGLAALLGAVIGGAASLLGVFGVEWAKARREARNYAIAAAGELAAASEMVRRRQWLEDVSSSATDAENGVVSRVSVHLPNEFLTATRGALTNAGNLPGALPSLVPRAVMLVDGIAADFKRLAEFDIGHPDSFLRADDPAGAKAVYSELFGVLLDGLATADAVVAEVKRLYPREAAAITTGLSSIEDMIAHGARLAAEGKI
ncbi:hypothetical protein [Luteimonas fraxinea]|uniref:Secreted protein n=1 Tax=Luteimonas fraxinea TaxID=2901869 RepID=A0ABS8UE82_9GAMM|nr:hypothetical protein [Luteimonas fraxinea]MCD9097024.1 hypothetical protein [Luteimonas fraxinea]